MRFVRTTRLPGAILPRSTGSDELRSFTSSPIQPMERPGLFARLFGLR